MSDLIEIISHDKSPRDDPDKDEQGPLIKISPDENYFVICIDKKFIGCNFDNVREGIRVDDYIVREENENTQVDGEKENELQDRKTEESSGEKGSTPQEVKVVKGYSRERTR